MTNVSSVGPFNASSVWVLPYPTRPTLRIDVADPQHSLVLYGSPADIGAEDSWEQSIWQFVVPRRLDGGSQLLLPHRYAYGLDWNSRPVDLSVNDSAATG